MRVPIACSLDASEARSQISEWHALIGRAVTDLDRSSPTTVTMTLRPDLVGLADLVQLAQREKACCAFFEFAIEIEADRARFVVSVPTEASDVLDDLVPSPPRTASTSETPP